MKAITFTIVTHKAQSLNYGETIGNVSTLKKLTIGNESPKKLITYVSDKALKYDIKRIGREIFNWKLMDNNIAGVIKECVQNIQNGKGEFNYQKFYEEMVKNYEEFDLFGGMFADIGGVYSDKKKKKIKINNNEIVVDIDTTKLQRTAPVRITNAYSISEFVYDSNLLNDIDAYNRYIQFTAGEKKQTLAYSDEHCSYYTYTIAIDLEKTGEFCENNIKKTRIETLLKIIFLNFNRKIRGRIENLTPIFLIGGIFESKHPFFHNSISFFEKENKIIVNSKDIINVIGNHSLPREHTYLYKSNEVQIIENNSYQDKLTEKSQISEIITEIINLV